MYKSKKEARKSLMDAGLSEDSANNQIKGNDVWKDLPEEPEVIAASAEDVEKGMNEQRTEITNLKTENAELKTSVSDMQKSLDKVNEKLSDRTVVEFPKEDKVYDYINVADFMMDVAKAGTQSASPTARLEKSQAAMIHRTAGTPSQETSLDSAGGFLVPEQYSANLMSIALEKSDFMGKATSLPIATDSIGIPFIDGFDHSSGSIRGNVQMKWTAELADKTATDIVVGKITLTLNELTGLSYVSDKLLNTSAISLEPLINKVFPEAMAWELDYVILNGTGAGQPVGVNACPAMISVPKVADQDADTIVFDNIANMYMRNYFKNSAIWVTNHDTFVQLSKLNLQADGNTAFPVFLPGGSIAGVPYNTIYNRPVLFTEHAPTLGDAGDIMFIAFSEYLVGLKSGRGAGLQTATSMHVKFIENQQAFRFVLLVDGQPWWKSALTPRVSDKTLSPFTRTAERA